MTKKKRDSSKPPRVREIGAREQDRRDFLEAAAAAWPKFKKLMPLRDVSAVAVADMVAKIKRFVANNYVKLRFIALTGQKYAFIAEKMCGVKIAERTARRLFAGKKRAVARAREALARHRLKTKHYTDEETGHFALLQQQACPTVRFCY